VVLSAVTVKQAKPKEKKYVLKDEKGLYLEISPAGGEMVATQILDEQKGKSHFPWRLP